MKITAEEKMMYGIMKAIYDSGIPMDFKGAMVLKACLAEAGYAEDIRHTVDIDANWNSSAAPTGEQMVDSISEALRNSGINLNVTLYRMYGEGRSAGFGLTDPSTDEILFSMDVDVNKPSLAARMYEIEGVRFRGVSAYQILSDKISAISTRKVFSRIKDVVDLYYLSHIIRFDRTMLIQTLEREGRTLGKFEEFINGVDELKHAYEKFRFSGNVNKPSFEEIYSTVKNYIKAILPDNNL
ncbi:MAG: nucleotidyl transferase AbiEii/AbiGii toxin family protein [Synergistes sp.]|nr:nucleotidyl transferase AbiEii/AbiGii toxin family protein [Synergistes sp.]